jgi:hypothetical protein
MQAWKRVRLPLHLTAIETSAGAELHQAAKSELNAPLLLPTQLVKFVSQATNVGACKARFNPPHMMHL